MMRFDVSRITKRVCALDLKMLTPLYCRMYSSENSEDKPMVKNEKEIMKPPPPRRTLGQPWFERQESWKSWFSHFQPSLDITSPDTVRKIQTPIDYSPRNLKKWYRRKKLDWEIDNQKFIEERYIILGPDLAAAHFVVARGGAIRFCGETEWIRLQKNFKINLPTTYVGGLFIEAIDAKGMLLYHEGFSNFRNLRFLNWISLEGVPTVDDWCLDLLSGEYPDQLEYLDISHCPNISFRGLSCFYRFEKLKHLKVYGISDSLEFKMACVMLEDILPKLNIEGVDFNFDDTYFEKPPQNPQLEIPKEIK